MSTFDHQFIKCNDDPLICPVDGGDRNDRWWRHHLAHSEWRYSGRSRRINPPSTWLILSDGPSLDNTCRCAQDSGSRVCCKRSISVRELMKVTSIQCNTATEPTNPPICPHTCRCLGLCQDQRRINCWILAQQAEPQLNKPCAVSRFFFEITHVSSALLICSSTPR